LLLRRGRRRTELAPPLQWGWPSKAATSLACVVVFWGSVEGAKRIHAVYFDHVWTHKYLAYELGVLGYHVYDLVSTLNEALSPTEISGEEIDKVRRWFDRRLAEDRRAPVDPAVPFGIARGKNVIYIQVESLMPDLIGRRFAGRELTPNLNRLMAESISFPFCFDQTSSGRSSDGDYTAHNSLYPAAKGSFVIHHSQIHLPSLPQVLRPRGYSTYMSCGMDGAFWKMSWVHRRYGFEKCLYGQDLIQDEPSWLGISDVSFFRQNLDRVAQLPR